MHLIAEVPILTPDSVGALLSFLVHKMFCAHKHNGSVESQAPSARACHPREEHLLPLMVAAGAAQFQQAKVTFDDKYMGTKVSAFEWD